MSRPVNFVSCASGALIMMTLMSGCVPPFEKVPDARVNADQRAAAERFATEVLGAWNEGKTANVESLLSEEMKPGFTEKMQKSYAEINAVELGRFAGMEFVEVQQGVKDRLLAYRFKGTFSRKKNFWEVRVVYDPDGKISGFWAKPWKDSFQ